MARITHPGATQADDFKSHTHNVASGAYTGSAYPGDSYVAGYQGWSAAQTSGSAGGAETRPKNVAVTFCQYNGGGGGGVSTTTLAGLSDVSISSPTTGQALVYNSGTSTWGNGSAGLSGGSAGYGAVWSSSSALTYDSALYVDTTNHRVGIGTTSPTSKLHVNGSLLVDAYNNSNAGIFFRPGFDTANYYNASIMPYDHNGDTAKDGISINGYDGVSFSTGSNSRNERMRIDSSGNVGIGTTNPIAKLEVSAGDSSYVIIGPNATWGAKLRVGMYTGTFPGDTAQVAVSNGNIHIDSANSGYTTYLNYFSGGPTYANNLSYSSDRRLKEDIADMDKGHALSVVSQLRPVSFKWNPETNQGRSHKDTQYGLIAQEVQKVLPTVVTMTTIPAPSQRAGEKTVMVPLDQKLGKIFGIDYPALIPWLLASVQELKTLFEGDHDTLINLRAANDNLRKEFEAYKAAHP